MPTPLLSDAELATARTELPDWNMTGDTLTRTITAASFPAGIELVGQVAAAAEAANHHPDIDIRWRKITFALTTHDAGGLTTNDVALAHEIDRLAELNAA